MPKSALYPYPPVQYIPLHLEPVFRKEPVPVNPFLRIGQDAVVYCTRLSREFGWDPPALPPCRDKLPVLAGGVEPFEAKYRGFYVTIRGAYRPCLSLLLLPAKYFYRSCLVFQVKDAGGKRLLSRVYRLP